MTPDDHRSRTDPVLNPSYAGEEPAHRQGAPMSEQDRYIPGVPCWVDTAQPDPEAATTFYGGLFDWTFENVMPPEAPGRYYLASRPGGNVAAIGSQPEGAPPEATWDTYIWVEDADETAEKARAAGGTVVAEPY